MKSVRSVYKIGHGPSSSHTVGPYNAAVRFGRRHPDADRFRVILYGSLAFTGAGHGTGKAILSGLPGAEIVVDMEEKDIPHPNTMLFTAFKDGQEIESVRVFSVGGGSVRFEDEPDEEEREIYPEKNLEEILEASGKGKGTASGIIYPLYGGPCRPRLNADFRRRASSPAD